MKRFETFLDKHCGQPFANIKEDASGGLVFYEDAMEEITRLNAQIAELEKENEDSRIFEIDGKQFLTTTQAAKALCCHYSNVYRMAEVGAIPKPINMGIKKKFLWLKSDIDGFIKSRMSEGGAA